MVFNVLSLFLGHSVIHLPSIPPYAYFNVRYGLMALPMLAFGIAYLFGSRKYLVIILMAAVGLQYSYFYYTHNIITIKDARIGASGFYLDDIGDWLNQNASDGLILVATSSHDALIFTARLPLSRYVSEGMIGYWDAALKTPSNYVKYIVMHDGDLVSKSMKDNKDFEYNYELVFKGNFSDVYKLKTIYN